MIDRKKYKLWISKKNMDNWNCPTCHKGILEYKDENFKYDGNSAYHLDSSPSPYSHLYQLENDIKFRYTLFLNCTNPSCKESVVSIGQCIIDSNDETNVHGKHIYVEDYYFNPKYFHPPLHIFQIPKGTPEKVKENIIKSFNTFFSDYESSANSLRIALECIINTLNEKPELRKLHKKIENLVSPKYDSIRDKCMALKWLGNDGSHCDDKKIESDNILDGYDLLSFILEELYIDESNHLDTITERLNEKKGI